VLQVHGRTLARALRNFGFMSGIGHGIIMPSPSQARHPSVTESVVLPPDTTGSAYARKGDPPISHRSTSPFARSAGQASWNGKASDRIRACLITTMSSATSAITSRSRRRRKERRMERYIHRENLALLKRRLAELQDETTRKVIVKLLAEEEAKDPPLNKQR